MRRTPDCAAITAFAHDSTGHVELIATDAGLRQDLVWSDNSISSGLARRLIGELAALEPNRLRRCARTACDLLFHDTTRSRTRRWHAEDPAGAERRLSRSTDLVAWVLFDADERFAPALCLPSPWWWITWVALVSVALCVLAAIHRIYD